MIKQSPCFIIISCVCHLVPFFFPYAFLIIVEFYFCETVLFVIAFDTIVTE